ncbi:MAG: DMT family transporter [Gammaproteobacteria bacterium]|jgi:drug/metabolite transporter (DMT)-like permease
MIAKLKSAGRHLLLNPYVALSLASLFWSGNFIVGRALRDAATAVTLNFWRWLIALMILLPVCIPAMRQQRALILQNWRLIVLLGITGIAAFHVCVYQALRDTTAINALLFLSLTPVTIVLGSWLLYRDQVASRQATGIAMSLAGATVVICRGDVARLVALQFNRGDLWMLAAMLLWAIYSVALKRKPLHMEQKALLGSSVTVGVAIMVPVYFAFGQSPVTMLAAGTGTIGGLLYISLFASVFSYFFWNRGVVDVGPNKAGVFLHLMPLFGAVLSFIFLGEGLQLYHWAGAVLIFTGIILFSRAR